jgi:hypothetical protein
MTPARRTVNDEIKWDDSARLVLIVARREAEELGSEYLGTEHLLLALVKETPTAHHRIPKLTYDSVKKTILELDLPMGVMTPSCQTPGYKIALESAAAYAFAESRPINRKDLWRGLLACSGSCGTNILSFLGIESNTKAAFA